MKRISLLHRTPVLVSFIKKLNQRTEFLLQLLMTGIAVLKVDDLGRRPLLIWGVGGIVSFISRAS